jgi:hypothetical protein
MTGASYQGVWLCRPGMLRECSDGLRRKGGHDG